MSRTRQRGDGPHARRSRPFNRLSQDFNIFRRNVLEHTTPVSYNVRRAPLLTERGLVHVHACPDDAQEGWASWPPVLQRMDALAYGLDPPGTVP